jgi:hypothetical protein
MKDQEQDLVSSEEQAGEAALGYIRTEWRPDYEPAVVRVEDVGDSWRVFYNNRTYLDTKAPGHTLIDNWPLRVVKASGAVEQDEPYRWGTCS